LAFAFGLSAEIERTLISQRTKEALARIRTEGKPIGRQPGQKPGKVKLAGHRAEIKKMLEAGVPKKAIGQMFGVHRTTVNYFLQSGRK
jgi:DNA invertase Pin-like site-specific DNA recombinase